MSKLDPDARYSAGEVARWLEHGAAWFSRNRARMEREDGFPPPISRVGRPRWLGEHLLAWERRDPRAQVKTTGSTDIVIDFSPSLRDRARHVAGGKRA